MLIAWVMISPLVKIRHDRTWTLIIAPLVIEPQRERTYLLTYAPNEDSNLKKPTDLDLHCLSLSM